MRLRKSWSNKLCRQAPGEPAGGAVEPAVEPAAAPVAAAAPDYSFLPEAFIKDGAPDIEGFKAHYAELSKPVEKAELPEAYDFTVSPDLKFDGLPEGMTIGIDAKDPAFAPLFDQLSGVLKELGAPADAGGKVASLLAQYEATKFGQSLKVQQAEMDTLGATAPARIEAVTRALQANLPADQVEAIQSFTKSAKALQALEKLLGPRSLTAPAQLANNAATEGMTPSQRLAYANSRVS